MCKKISIDCYNKMKNKLLSALAIFPICFSAHAEGFVNGVTPLMNAAASNNLYELKSLLERGFNTNRVDYSGNTAYCYAYQNKNYNAANMLANYGAKTKVRCAFNNQYYMTHSISTPYYNEASTSYVEKNYVPRSGFGGAYLPSGKAVLYSVLAAGGVAAAAGGGGGGGSDSSEGSPSVDDLYASEGLNLASHRTAEFYGDTSPFGGISDSDRAESLKIINADYAYARGYTGSGVTVAVLDSGIDVDHNEFSGQLSADLSNTNIQGINDGDLDTNNPDLDPGDNNHGATVAGSVAAKKDGSVMHGVAYDAKILPYRMGITGFPNAIDGDSTNEAITDGLTKGATVFNLSYGRDANAGSNASIASKVSIAQEYTGTSDGSEDGIMNTLAANVIANDAVIVKAAGNEEYSQSGSGGALPMQYNTFDGYFINVVALNKEGTALATTANSGWGSNACGVTKAYCLAAPGTGILTTGTAGFYSVSNGTSLASPIVAGSVAVVQSAFPWLTAPEVTNILFVTATDLGAAGVDDTYGQGLIDLAAATAPGAELLAVDGAMLPVNIASSKVVSSGVMAQASLPSFVITDELNRTFEISGNSLEVIDNKKTELQNREKSFGKDKVAVQKTLKSGLKTSFIMSDDTSNENLEKFEFMQLGSTFNNLDVSFSFTSNPGTDFETIKKSASFIQEDVVSHPYLNLSDQGFSANTSYNIYDNLKLETLVFFGDVENENDNLGKSTAASVKLKYYMDNSEINFETGLLNEESTLLGSKFEGAFALSDNNYTYFTGLSGKTKLTDKLGLFANAYVGVTKAKSVSNSLISDIDNIVSHSASMGLEYNISKTKTAGFVLAQPLKVSNGGINYNLATSRSADGSYNVSSINQDLSTEATEFNIQGFYKHKLNSNANLNLGAIHRINANHLKGEKDSAALVKFKYNF